MKCPQCDGEGTCTYEAPVVDYVYGGYLEEFEGQCDMCNGWGEIEDGGDE